MSIQQFGKKFPILLKTPNPKGAVELIEIIGKGNYGNVYKGRLTATNEYTAVKVVLLKEEELRETLLEMEFLKSCNHKNVTKFMGLFLKGFDLWICMELCGGGALDSIYRNLRKSLTEDQICSIMFEAIEGLDYIHKNAIIHRDIKAGNLFLTEGGEVKLGDFGVSAKLQHAYGRARTFIGTPYWMAPEVIMCDPESPSSYNASYNTKADIWSIGITAIEIADKNPPLSDIHPMRALTLIPTSELGLSKPKNWSKLFVEFIAICLTKDPNKRPSAEDLLKHPFLQRARTLRRDAILQDMIQKAKMGKEKSKLGIPVDDDEEFANFDQIVPEEIKNTLPPSQLTKMGSDSNIQQQRIISPSVLAVIEQNAGDPGFKEDGNPQNRLVNPVVIGPFFKVEILTSDYFSHYLLIGTDKALYYIDTSLPKDQQIPVELIINTRFKQIKVLEDYGVMMALSGKNSHIRQYNLASIKKLIRHSTGMSAQMIMNAGRNNNDEDEVYRLKNEEKIDDETTILSKWVNDYTKILATKDALSFAIERTETSVHMSVLFRQDIILFEWAKDPYLRFMKVKAFWLPETPKVMSVLHDGIVVSEIYLGYTNEANIVSVNDSHVSELPVSSDFIRAQPSNPGNSDRPRWQQFIQIPFSPEQKKLLQGTIRPMGTINKKLMAAVGPTINRQKKSTVDTRTFLATFGAVSRVVDIMGRPISTLQYGFGNPNGDFGSGYGIRWVDGPPKETIIIENKFVLSVGQNSLEVAVWRTGEVVQVLRHVNSIKLLQTTENGIYLYIGKKKRGGFIYKLEETAQAKALSQQMPHIPQPQPQQQKQPIPPPSRNYNQPNITSQMPQRQIPPRQQNPQPVRHSTQPNQQRVSPMLSPAQPYARPPGQNYARPPPVQNYSRPAPQNYPRPPAPRQQRSTPPSSMQPQLRSPRNSPQYSNRPQVDHNGYNRPAQGYQRPAPNRAASTPASRQDYYGTGVSSVSNNSSYSQYYQNQPQPNNYNMRDDSRESYDYRESHDYRQTYDSYERHDRYDGYEDYYDSYSSDRSRERDRRQNSLYSNYSSSNQSYSQYSDSRQSRQPSHQQQQRQYQQMNKH